jgi:hypothetical protein
MFAFQHLQAPVVIKYGLNPCRVKVYGFFPEIKSKHLEMLAKKRFYLLTTLLSSIDSQSRSGMEVKESFVAENSILLVLLGA